MKDRTITIERLIQASSDKVWRAWTDPAMLPQWFGPVGYSCKTKQIDLRTGGLWRFDMIGPDGKIWPNRHHGLSYRPIDQITFLLDDDTDANPAMQVTVTLAPQGAATLLTQTILFPNAAARDGAVSFGAVELGKTTLAKLAALVEG